MLLHLSIHGKWNYTLLQRVCYKIMSIYPITRTVPFLHLSCLTLWFRLLGILNPRNKNDWQYFEVDGFQNVFYCCNNEFTNLIQLIQTLILKIWGLEFKENLLKLFWKCPDFTEIQSFPVFLRGLDTRDLSISNILTGRHFVFGTLNLEHFAPNSAVTIKYECFIWSRIDPPATLTHSFHPCHHDFCPAYASLFPVQVKRTPSFDH